MQLFVRGWKCVNVEIRLSVCFAPGGGTPGITVPAMRHEDTRMRMGGLKLIGSAMERHQFQDVPVEKLFAAIIEKKDVIEMDAMAITQLLGTKIGHPQ